ncbi:MAG: hypothetical protein KGL52_14100 [Rhodospirillales bacterium]|nr:hypothetical protein [Rhodospirillales bacterium]
MTRIAPPITPIGTAKYLTDLRHTGWHVVARKPIAPHDAALRWRFTLTASDERGFRMGVEDGAIISVTARKEGTPILLAKLAGRAW